MEIDQNVSKGRIRFARVCAAAALAVAVAALAGWIVDVEWLRSPISGTAPLRPVSAILIAAAAASLITYTYASGAPGTRGLMMLVGLAIAATAGYVLTSHATGSSNATDYFLVPGSLRNGSGMGYRMPPQPAVNLILIGGWLFLMGFRGGLRRFGAYLAHVSLCVSFTVALAIAYRSTSLTGYADNNDLALTWIIAFFGVTLAGIALNEENRLLSLFLSDSMGGSAARRLFPAVVLVPTLVGWARVAGHEYGYVSNPAGTIGSVLVMVLFMFAIVAYYSRRVHERDLESRAMQEAIEANESRYRDLFEYSRSILSTHDMEGRITSVNAAFVEATGYTAREVIGRRYKDFTPREFRGESDAYLRGVVNDGEAQGLATIITKNGKRLVWEYRNILIDDGTDEPYVLGSALDVTHHLKLQRQLEKVSLTDEVTGLLNRRGFLTLAEQQLKLESRQNTARGLMLMFADMDGLKRINDTLGHEAGTEALQILARALKSAVRSADLVARWGGDEFVILAAGADEANATMIAARIKESLDAFNTEGVRPFTLACSIGSAPVDLSGGRSLEEIIAQADEAMYEAKMSRKAAREPNKVATRRRAGFGMVI